MKRIYVFLDSSGYSLWGIIVSIPQIPFSHRRHPLFFHGLLTSSCRFRCCRHHSPKKAQWCLFQQGQIEPNESLPYLVKRVSRETEVLTRYEQVRTHSYLLISISYLSKRFNYADPVTLSSGLDSGRYLWMSKKLIQDNNPVLLLCNCLLRAVRIPIRWAIFIIMRLG